MKGIVVALTLLAPLLSHAGERDDVIKQIMEAQGLIALFEQQLELGRQQSREQSRAAINQMLSGLNPTPEFRQRFQDAAQNFEAAIETPWSAEEIVRVWGSYYGAQFSDQELNQLLAHYRTPLAQREIVASREAMVQFSTHFAEAGKPILEKATADFVRELQLIARECNCKR